ncbi:MAG TPA: DUF2383 domain-containing protein [Planktothrix sp.]|jgi:hypothetical protein
MSHEYIEEFNAFLTGEISAVETYGLALKSVASEDIRRALVDCQNSHAERVDKLITRVRDLGGTPADSAGMWGPLAAAAQTGAGNETDAIAKLEQSEAERLVQYEAQQKLVESPVLDVLKQELLPAQHETHLTMSSLLKQMLPAEQ